MRIRSALLTFCIIALANTTLGATSVKVLLNYNSKALTDYTQLTPTVVLYALGPGTTTKPAITYAQSSFTITNPQDQTYQLYVGVDANSQNRPMLPGDYFGAAYLTKADTGPLTINMVRIAHLRQPLDNATHVNNYQYDDCSAQPTTSSPVQLAWDPVPEARYYTYGANAQHCGTFAFTCISNGLYDTTSPNGALDLPADPNIFYGFYATGWNDQGQAVSAILVSPNDNPNDVFNPYLRITAGRPPAPLSCSVVAPFTGTAGKQLTFAATIKGACAPQWEWSFGDGKPGAVYGPDVVWSYSAPGSYTWTMKVTTGDETCTKTGTITIAGTSPTVTTFTATQSTITQGGTSTLSWTTTNASSVTIDNGVGSKPVNGSTGVSPTVTTTYKLTASNGSQSTTAQVTVTVQPSPTCSYALQPPNANFPAAGGPGSITPVALIPGTCPTNASSNAAWITITGTGAKVSYQVAQNTTTAPRTGTITMSGQSFTISQKEPPASTDLHPLVFVPGFCHDLTTWDAFVANIQNTTYAGPAQVLYFDGSIVREWGTGKASINATGTYIFEAVTTSNLNDKSLVQQLQIEDEAYQLGQVIAAIRYQRNTSTVDLVAHSLGGLVARALVEGFAIRSSVTYDNPGGVGHIVTIDTPHGGVDPSALATLAGLFGACFLQTNSTQALEMRPLSSFLQQLNTTPIPPNILTTALATTTQTCQSSRAGSIQATGDFVVPYAAQQLLLQCPNITHCYYLCAPNVADETNAYWDGDDTAGCPFLPVTRLGMHSYSHDDPAVARHVVSFLTATTYGKACGTPTPAAPLTIAPPVGALARNTTVTVTFTPLALPSAQGVNASAACTVDVLARTSDARTIAKTTIDATGTHVAALGVISGTGWHIELWPTCTVTAQVTLALTDTSVPRHRTVAPPAQQPSSVSAAFTWTPTSPTIGQAIQFTDLSTGSPTSWSWTFGDGATASSPNPQHTYASPGTYNVNLIATRGSTQNSATHAVSVTSCTYTVLPTTVPFAASGGTGSVIVSVAANCSWTVTSDAQFITVSPIGGTGAGSVTLTAAANSGAPRTATLTIAGHSVTVIQSSALLPVLTGVLASDTLGLQSATQITFSPQGASDPGGEPLSFTYDFGDGQTSTLTPATHVFNSSGTFNVRLTVTNSNGGSAMASTQVTIKSVTGQWAGTMTCPPSRCGSLVQFPITIDAKQSGSTVTGTSVQLGETCTFSIGTVSTPRQVYFGQLLGCSLVQSNFGGCFGSLDSSLNRLLPDTRGESLTCDLTRQ